jgi:hypothetical protein
MSIEQVHDSGNITTRFPITRVENGNGRKQALSFSFPHITPESKTKTKTPKTNMEAAITGDGYDADT